MSLRCNGPSQQVALLHLCGPFLPLLHPTSWKKRSRCGICGLAAQVLSGQAGVKDLIFRKHGVSQQLCQDFCPVSHSKDLKGIPVRSVKCLGLLFQARVGEAGTADGAARAFVPRSEGL